MFYEKTRKKESSLQIILIFTTNIVLTTLLKLIQQLKQLNINQCY